MAFDEKLADRVREALASQRGVTERKMFGGIGFMIGQNMCAGVHGNELIVRVGDGEAAALKDPHARPMTMGKMRAKGMVFVAPAGVRTAKGLSRWLDKGIRVATSLPAKDKHKKPSARRSRA